MGISTHLGYSHFKGGLLWLIGCDQGQGMSKSAMSKSVIVLSSPCSDSVPWKDKRCQWRWQTEQGANGRAYEG